MIPRVRSAAATLAAAVTSVAIAGRELTEIHRASG